MTLVENTPWYNIEDLSTIYRKYSLLQFYNWWTNGTNKIMELRITNVDTIKMIAKKYNLEWSYSGVYIETPEHLSNIVKDVRNIETMWMGVQPRKKNWNIWGNKSFGSGPKGGTADVNVNEITMLFIDVDRKVQGNIINGQFIKTPGTRKDLEDCNNAINFILDIFKQYGFANNYCKICSGNGVQLLIKLDVPILVPEVIFNNNTKNYEYNKEYEDIRTLIYKGIGIQIKSFEKEILKKYPQSNIVIDKSAFTLSRVCALHASSNRKYTPQQWRGIVELVENGENVGLTDYIIACKNKEEKNVNIFKNINKSVNIKNIIREGQLFENEIVKLLLSYDFPEGGINNTLWFQLKCLLRDSKYNVQTEEFREFHNLICKKHGRTFTINFPDTKFSFNEDVINKYCINNLIPLIYPLYKKRNKKIDYKLEGIQNVIWTDLEKRESNVILNGNEIMDDFKELKSVLKEGDFNNVKIVRDYLIASIKKYNLTTTKYYFENILFKLLEYN